MKEVVIIGAGKIGRGYMAQIFFEAGFTVTFVDILPDLIDSLNAKGQYEIHEVDTGVRDVYTISNVRAIHADDVESVINVLTRVSLAVTSVGAGNLPHVARNVAAAVRFRKSKKITEPLNILVAENLMNGAQKFAAMVQEFLSKDEISYMDQYVGIVGSVIGRTVPPPPPSFAERNIADVIVEPHREFYVNQFDFMGDPPHIDGIKLTTKYDAAVSRKLYVHNCTHAVMGYVGYLKAHQYSHEAMADEQVSKIVWLAMKETAKAVELEYGFSEEEMQQYISDLFHRYQNAELWDTLTRIGRDPIRKLQPDDRLVGAARLIEKTGGLPEALVAGIAAALCFNAVEDLKSVKLQAMIAESGVSSVLTSITGISDSEPLGRSVLQTYQRLRQV